MTTELRDVALAILIKRHNESFADYGLPSVRLNEVQMLQPTTVGFVSDEDRQNAFAKWFAAHPADDK